MKLFDVLVESGCQQGPRHHRVDGANASIHSGLRRGTLKSSDCWWSPIPAKTKCETNDGTLPLHAAAHQGHIEVVRFLVETPANIDGGGTNDGGTPLILAAHQGQLEVFRLSGGVGCQQGPRQDRLQEKRLFYIAAEMRAP